MGTGYTRNDTANNIADGNIINASDLDGEFDAIVSAFGTSGHTHDGTANEGGAITKIGPAQQVTVSATALYPSTANAVALGTTSNEFSDLYMADGSIIYLGADQDVTLTHVADTGILLNSTRQLQFGDSGSYIHQSADGVLDLVSDTEIEINATTIDMNGAVEISGNTTVGGTLTSTGKITADAGIDIDNFNIDGTTIALSSGDMTLDGAGDIILDAAGEEVIFKDGSTNVGHVSMDSDNLTIKSLVSDKDIIFQGNDGGSGITALTLDMSEAGAATFNNKIVATELDISGNVDIDGTLEADAITIDGTTLAETIADTVGAMVTSNTETGISVTYEDGDNTLDFALGAAQTTITSLLATDIKIGEDDETKIDFETADEIHFYAANVEQVYLGDNIFGPQSDSDVDLGSSSVRWKDAYVDSITVTGEVDGASLDISGDADIDGTLEADAITVDGTALATYIRDTVGTNMLSSNTESGITVTYDTSNDNIDFAIDAAQTTITSVLATDLKVGEDDQTKIDFEDADQINFYADNTKRVTIDSTGLTVNSGSIETATIDYTDGDNAMTIADGGKVTFAAGFDVGSDASGDILYHNGTSYVRLAKGTDDQVLTLASGVPAWAAASAGDITGVTAGTGLSGGGTSGGVTVNVEAAQTGITSLLATDIKIGEDDQTKIDFEDADTINFYAGNEKQLILTDGALTPGTNAILDLGTDALEFKDAYFDGTVEADAITIGGTAIGSIYSAIAGSSSIVTTGALDSGSITSGFGAIDNGTSGIRTNTFTAETSILPDAVGGADLGSTSAEWGDIYIADDKAIKFGNDQDVTMEYDEDGTDSLLISGSDVTIVDDKKLYFGTGQDVYLEYDEDGTDTLIIKGDTTFLDGTYDFDIASHDNGTNGLKLGGTLVTASAAELNYVDGVTSNIQTQLNATASTGKAIAMSMVFG